MTRNNSDNAAQADQLMGEAKEIVGRANESMGQLAVSMAEITRASEETSKIIKTIDEIAFQTNLLALNAAKNTSELIEGTTREVRKGSELAEGTNAAFEEAESARRSHSL